MDGLRQMLAPIDPEILEQIRPEWNWAVPAGHRTIGMTLMGDWLFLDPDGAVFLLDTLEANLTPVAASVREFEGKLDSPEMRDELLLEGLALGVLGDGPLPHNHCVGQRVPAILGGGTDLSNLAILPVAPYQTWMARLHRALADVPDGAEVTGVDTDDAGGVHVGWR